MPKFMIREVAKIKAQSTLIMAEDRLLSIVMFYSKFHYFKITSLSFTCDIKGRVLNIKHQSWRKITLLVIFYHITKYFIILLNITSKKTFMPTLMFDI